jgi:hypothetical protein
VNADALGLIVCLLAAALIATTCTAVAWRNGELQMTPEELDAFWAQWHTAWKKRPRRPAVIDDDPREPNEPEPLSAGEEARLDNWAQRQMEAMWP